MEENNGLEIAQETDQATEEKPTQDRQVECVLCRVRLRPETTAMTFHAGGLRLKEGEWVVVPTPGSKEVGQIISKPVKVTLPERCLPPAVERLATTSEIEEYYKNIEFEKKAWSICQGHIDRLGLKMKLIKVESFFDHSKIIFYYSADGRVDFRELVKALVRDLRMRVEMRQIGIRHEAKLVGGIGCCGRELCCASFLTSFDSISIKMAKTQNLPLNPSKISGLCGRLLCCLTYEYQTYKEMAQNLPTLGKACQTPTGQGKVIRQNIFKQAVTVAMPDGSIIEYTVDELEGKKKPEAEPAPESGSGDSDEAPQEPKDSNKTQDKGRSQQKEQKRKAKKRRYRGKQAKASKKKGKKRGAGKARSGNKNSNKKGKGQSND